MSFFTEDELEKAWGNADFGPVNNKELYLYQAMMKLARGYHNGSTSQAILEDLKLADGRSWTDRGIKFIENGKPRDVNINCNTCGWQQGFYRDPTGCCPCVNYSNWKERP